MVQTSAILTLEQQFFVAHDRSSSVRQNQFSTWGHTARYPTSGRAEGRSCHILRKIPCKRMVQRIARDGISDYTLPKEWLRKHQASEPGTCVTTINLLAAAAKQSTMSSRRIFQQSTSSGQRPGAICFRPRVSQPVSHRERSAMPFFSRNTM